MDGAIDHIRTVSTSLRPAEAKVASTLLADPSAAVESTVAELAASAKVSQASVVRFARAAGFAGFPELRLAVAQELSRRQVELERSNIAEGEINASDTLAEVVQKLAFHEARSVEQTARLIDLDALEQVATTIASGASCITFGVGASALSAADLAQKLQRIGLPSLNSADTHVQLVHGALASPGSVAVAFSFGGHTAEIHRCLELAKQRGALTVAVTGAPDSPVGKAADVVLLTSAREAQLRAAALASRMTQLAVVDFLFVRVTQLRFDDIEAALERTRAAVLGQRLLPDG